MIYDLLCISFTSTSQRHYILRTYHARAIAHPRYPARYLSLRLVPARGAVSSVQTLTHQSCERQGIAVQFSSKPHRTQTRPDTRSRGQRQSSSSPNTLPIELRRWRCCRRHGRTSEENLLLPALAVLVDRDGHHHDRPAERRQDLSAARSGGESFSRDASPPPAASTADVVILGRRIHHRVSVLCDGQGSSRTSISSLMKRVSY